MRRNEQINPRPAGRRKKARARTEGRRREQVPGEKVAGKVRERVPSCRCPAAEGWKGWNGARSFLDRFVLERSERHLVTSSEPSAVEECLAGRGDRRWVRDAAE